MLVALENTPLMATVDEEDYEAVSGFMWRLTCDGYVASGKHLRLHKMLAGIPEKSSIHVHHKDGNRLNNSKSNLVRTSHGKHSRVHVADALEELREWAKCNGIKKYELMTVTKLKAIKAKIENHPKFQH